MNPRLRELSEDTLKRLADAVSAGRIAPPWPDEALPHLVTGPAWLGDELRGLTAAGVAPAALGWALGMVVAERAEARRRWEGIELVWTGPEDVVTETRDTGAVVRQLFATATHDLLVASYAIDDDAQARDLLGVLQERMEALPNLRVRFFVNIARKHGDLRPADALVDEYAHWFATRVWPTGRRPDVYYDRRALMLGSGPRACMHAKCVVQDGERALITSANLTDAAQNRNIEVGVLVRDVARCAQIIAGFEGLRMRQVPGWDDG